MVKQNLEQVLARIATSAKAAGRDPSSIRLVCVTKGVPAETIKEAVSCGAADIGENRVQEAEKKQPLVGRGNLRWHMIGHLQRNKVKEALEVFDAIHSVDRPELAEAIDRAAQALKRTVDVFVQVNAAKIETRFGADPDAVPALVDKVKGLSSLNLLGLMVMAPYAENPEDVRPVFRQVRDLGLRVGAKELSMGMSNDFEVAVQEGATMVRIGTAIFG